MFARQTHRGTVSSKSPIQNSIRGGPASIVGMGTLMRNSKTIDRDSSLEKKEAKRIQLRHLLLNKFKNKFLVLNRIKDPDLTYKITQKIEDELVNLFQLQQFQEKDLVKADKNIRDFVISISPGFEMKSKSIDRMTKTIDFSKNRLAPISDYGYETKPAAKNYSSIDRSKNGSRTSHDKYDLQRGSLQMAKSLVRDIASRGDLSSRQQQTIYHHRQSTAAPGARSFRISAEFDPLTKLRMRKDDNWNKIIQYNQKVHQISLKEAQQKKKEHQLQMREALKQQLEMKEKCKIQETLMDSNWMKENMEKVTKQISEDEMKIREKRMKLQRVNQERFLDAQQRQERKMMEKTTLQNFELTSQLYNEKLQQEEKEKNLKKFNENKNDAKMNIEKFYQNQNQMREQREKETLIYGGFSHMAEEIKPGSNIRTSLISSGIQPQYNDIFNNVFKNKTPAAVHLAEKTEARLKIINQKFDLNNSYRAEQDNNRLIKEVYAKTQKDNSELEKRQQKRKKLALQARDFQFVQMKENERKRVEQLNLQKEFEQKARNEYELQRQEALHNSEQKKQKLRQTQEILFQQMQERREKMLVQDNMNSREEIFNQDILTGPESEDVINKIKKRPY